MASITKNRLVEILNVVMKQKRQSDNYIDGVLDMYNAVVKEVNDGERKES